MNKFTRNTSIILLLSVSTNLIPSLNAFAEERTVNALAPKDYSIETSEVSPRIGPVAVFLAGVLVGYIIEGGLIHYTGHGGGEWVAIALDYYYKCISTGKNISSIHISSSGTVHGGGGGDF